MEIVINYSTHVDFVRTNNPKKNETVQGYSTMHPIKSPIFIDGNQVRDWFHNLSFLEKRKFVDHGIFCIYSHTIACKDMILSHGYHAKEGEVLSTDEAWIWEWLPNKGWTALT